MKSVTPSAIPSVISSGSKPTANTAIPVPTAEPRNLAAQSRVSVIPPQSLHST
ncbi:unknown protein [Microcystis aeruginosa NIES-843]|uniref:Uncharacterized protein n=1 Tax=Microcystis aeruginosa (strain NIES-843 / IAM M-2473) TaxID=449447 RepID=B0JKQ8_MICAN|nr:unknown protein [Microcystis aeruginosa NIES-843]